MLLAGKGLEVLMVDRATFPRAKLCGDTLNPGCLAILDRIDAAVAKRIRACARAITGMTITGPGGVTVKADYPAGLGGAALLRRSRPAIAALGSGRGLASAAAIAESLGKQAA